MQVCGAGRGRAAIPQADGAKDPSAQAQGPTCSNHWKMVQEEGGVQRLRSASHWDLRFCRLGWFLLRTMEAPEEV